MDTDPSPAETARVIGSDVWRSGRPRFLCYVGVTVAEALVPVGVAWLTKLVIDSLAAADRAGRADRLTLLAVALAGAGVAVSVLPHWSDYLSKEIGRAFTARTTERLFAALCRLPGLTRFEDPRFLDRLQIAQDSMSLGGSTVTGLFGTVRATLGLSGFVGSLFVISPAMTGVVMVVTVPALIAQYRLSRRRAELALRLEPMDRRRDFYARLLGDVEAAKEVRLFGIGGFLRGRMTGELRAANAANRSMDRRELAVEAALATLGALVAAGGLVWAVGAARSGALTTGDVSMFIIAVASLQASLNTLISSLAGSHTNLLMFGHYAAILRVSPDLRVAAAPRAVEPLRRGIELRDVWFRYDDAHPWILRGVDLFIPLGGTVALVGLNGAGKSTLVKLLCRFYDPDRGTITWDGLDLRVFDPDDLRGRITAVFQDHMAYDFSARDNIGVGDLGAFDDLWRIRSASHRAGIDGTLATLPRGYETLLTRKFYGDDDREDPSTGVSLSGGQWQRVALARAFLRCGRDLLILDEPSSGLDPEAEADVHERMRRTRSGHTSLLISHRLNTVRYADHIVVLAGGAVAETGTHDELLAAAGIYARLFATQSAGYRDDAPRISRSSS